MSKPILQKALKIYIAEIIVVLLTTNCTEGFHTVWRWCESVTFVYVFYYRNSVQGNEHEVYPTIQMRHAALERNKRCLLTYLYVS